MTTESPLPGAILSELTRLLDEGVDGFWSGVARLCSQHAALAARICDEARDMQNGLGSDDRGGTAPALGRRSAPAADLRVGDPVGPFAILDVIGHGGMGSVYLAEQKEPVRRRVALKVVKLGMDTKAVLARFEAERQALALMDHSHIARVFEAGMTPQGRPYFAMEYVRGIPITKYCDQNKLSVDDRLALFIQVCSGVQHAHTKGVIHRDLTPNNVLVTLQEDGKPAAKIIDFGLARATDHRLTEKTLFTEQGVILGTPEYMSPEQAGLNALDIDMRSDVYTLGVLLYELLSGELPFESRTLRAAGYQGMCRTIRETEPQRPSTKVATQAGGAQAVARLRRTDAATLLRRLRGDLDWIVLKCLEKDRTRRYETVAELRADLQRHLGHQPVLARAPSVGYRLGKFARRYRGHLVAVATVFLSLVAGIVGTTSGWLAARANESQATASAARAVASEQRAVVSAEEAERERAAAERSAERAEARKREFDQLACIVLYQQAVRSEPTLYPAWPERSGELQRWLDQTADLLAQRGAVETTLASLRARSLPATDAELRLDREAHPRFDEWQRRSAELGARERAAAIRAGEELRLPVLTAAERAMTPRQLNDRAWPRVSHDRRERVWGEELRGLALAREAWDRRDEAPPKERASLADTLAWAWFANGADDEALAQMDRAVALAPADKTADYEGFRTELRERVAAAGGATEAAALATLRADVAALDAAVGARRTFRFATESERFLHDNLRQLLVNLEALDRDLRPAVERRLRWAREIGRLTAAHPRAPATWEAARAAIAAADGKVASTLYAGRGIDLRPQLGLVPIGMNPATKLWEFYHLRSAWDGETDPAAIEVPAHDAGGNIEFGDSTGIVFVLLPGGSSTMGAQRDDPGAPFYDDLADADELPCHEVELGPFFLARTELTQGQWQRFATPPVPSYFHPGIVFPGVTISLAHPVESVGWDHVVAWLGRLGLLLPTEAQWEYACRAGTTTPWSCGSDSAALETCANIADACTPASANWAWTADQRWNDGFVVHAPVASFAPNRFGFYDMHGNVWEWTADGAFEYENVAAAPVDGLRGDPAASPTRVYRGGGYSDPVRNVRSSKREKHNRYLQSPTTGVRPARSLER